MTTVRHLVTEDGQIYAGAGFGAEISGTGEPFELVFNTSMVGYQEILSDPSYADQGVVFAYPLVGNYGLAPDDFESAAPALSAAIVRNACAVPSNFRCAETLDAFLRRTGIPGLSGIDTRRLVRSIRDLGSRRAILSDGNTPVEECLARIRETPVPRDAVSRVSPKEITVVPAEGGERFTVAAVDCGMKENIVRSLSRLGCRVIRVPWDTPAEIIASFAPDGVLFSNGPGGALSVHGVGVVLRGDFDLPGQKVFHRVVAAAVSEFHLVGFRPVRQREDLMPEADAEDREPAPQSPRGVRHLRHVLRIAGAV